MKLQSNLPKSNRLGSNSPDPENSTHEGQKTMERKEKGTRKDRPPTQAIIDQNKVDSDKLDCIS